MHSASRSLVSFALILLGAASLWGESSEPEQAAAPAPDEALQPNPEERPRLFQPTELHPYRGGGMRYLDPWFAGGYAGHPYGSFGWAGSPYGYGHGYGWGRWGYRSHLYYDTFYGMLPAPGRSELSISVGSDDYFGTSLSTTQWLSKKHNIALNIGALWETGELWWSGQDYESFTIAPTLYWSNENTLIYASFEYTERNVASRDRSASTQRSSQRPSLVRNDSEMSMSPFAHDVAGATTASARTFEQPSGFRLRNDSDHTLQRATIGIDHQVTDFFSIGLNFEASDLKRKH